MSHRFLNIQENSFYCLHFRCKHCWQQDASSRMFRNKKIIVKSATSCCCCCGLHLAAAETCSFKWNYTIIQLSICKQLVLNKLEVLECCNNRKQWNCFQGLSAVKSKLLTDACWIFIDWNTISAEVTFGYLFSLYSPD